jgi:hypothetical protein
VPMFSAKTEVAVELDRSEVVAGESVRVRASFGEPDKKTQGARVELFYRNRYEHDTRDSDGDVITTTDISYVIVTTQKLAVGGGPDGWADVELLVPPDVPGSAGESVEWAVRAIVDRKLARDATAETPITVLTSAANLASWAELPAGVSTKCPMVVSPDRRMVRRGDRISGTLVLHPDSAISARAIRVQLHRERYDPDQNTSGDDAVRVELSGPRELEPGSELSLPFDIEVPLDAEPSFEAENNTQHWFLQGVVDVARAGDPFSSIEVVVGTA